MLKTRPVRSRLRRSCLAAGRVIAVVPLLLVGCQGSLIYFPRAYDEHDLAGWRRQGIRPVEFVTAQGRQTAWLHAPAGKPERVWIVCGGNGALALDYHSECLRHLPEDAFLYVDYPGYGKCEGSAHPKRIRESIRTVWPLAAQELGLSLPEMAERGRFFGHSLGAAAVLMAAEEHGLSRGVLVAPFTSTMDMAREMLKLPLGFLVWHRFDNRATLRTAAGRSGAKISIVHGTADEVIPVRMGRELAAAHPKAVTLHEVPRGHHNSIFEEAPEVLGAALREVR